MTWSFLGVSVVVMALVGVVGVDHLASNRVYHRTLAEATADLAVIGNHADEEENDKSDFLVGCHHEFRIANR